MQAAASDFSSEPCGHCFVLRMPLAKATAHKCANCGLGIKQHSRKEVTDEQLLSVLNAQDDGSPTIILPGELAVGGYKAALGVCKGTIKSTAVINAAGTGLHAFLPGTRKDFDVLRGETPPRLIDVEWEDADDFKIELEDFVKALAWARTQVEAGNTVLVNCAQGKSRSGTLATAYCMAKFDVGVEQALAMVRGKRPLVQPSALPEGLKRPAQAQATVRL